MRVSPRFDDLSAVWLLLLVRAGIVLVVSVAALPWPTLSLVALIVLASTIAIVAGLMDAAISGALHRRSIGAWALLPEAVVGTALGGTILLYPVVSLRAIEMLMVVWMIARGLMLVFVARAAGASAVVRTAAAGWAVVSVAAPAMVLLSRSETNILTLVYVLVAYALVWAILELSIAMYAHLQRRRVQRT